MNQGLSFYARQLMLEPEALQKAVDVPMLLWRAAPGADEPDVLLTTQGGAFRQGPSARDPLVVGVKKAAKAHNAFAMGITLGRTESNDVVLVDNSVSRFHAYFQQDARGETWRLVDAESKYGTWIGPMKLPPNKPHPLQDGVHLRFGNIEVIFYLPGSFLAYLKKVTSEDPPP